MSTTRRVRCPSRLLIPVFLIVALTTGCQTTVGNYLVNRARDLGECFLLQTGLGVGLGADVKAAGLLHVAGIAGLYVPSASLGLVYGQSRPSDEGFGETDSMEGFIGIPFSLLGGGIAHYAWREQSGIDLDDVHVCYGFLPGLISFTGSGEYPHEIQRAYWIWSKKMKGDAFRWARIHAFDIEASVYAGIVYARAGFSPGEFVDFLLGWIGVDIAGDDRGLEPEEKASEGVGEEQLRLRSAPESSPVLPRFGVLEDGGLERQPGSAGR